MRYEGSVYRPPSEAYSLILQATVGCSHNGCIFCGMYKDKRFHLRPIDEVLEDLADARSTYTYVDRIFIADGDALIMKTEHMLAILDFIKEHFPECQRVTSYATPRSLLLKTPEELALIREHGLFMLYLGLESGSDEILTRMNKGATSAEIVLAGQKAKTAGFTLSVTILSGLGGKEMWEEHALQTAKAISDMKPDYVGEMTLNIMPGTKLKEEVDKGLFILPSPTEILTETRLLIEHIDNEGCVFRSNHVSNYLNIRGTFNAGRQSMMAQIDAALASGQIREKHYTQM